MKYQKGRFVVVPNIQVLATRPASLLSVYFWICSFADINGQCFPSIKKLCLMTNLSENTVILSIKKLEELNILKKTNRFKDNEKTTNLYQIMLISDPESTPPTSTIEVPTSTIEDRTISPELKENTAFDKSNASLQEKNTYTNSEEEIELIATDNEGNELGGKWGRPRKTVMETKLQNEAKAISRWYVGELIKEYGKPFTNVFYPQVRRFLKKDGDSKMVTEILREWLDAGKSEQDAVNIFKALNGHAVNKYLAEQ